MTVLFVLLTSCSNTAGTSDLEVKKQTATIEGVVRELGTEVPIAGVSVFVVRTSDQPQIRTNTDGDGRLLPGSTPDDIWWLLCETDTSSQDASKLPAIRIA